MGTMRPVQEQHIASKNKQLEFTMLNLEHNLKLTNRYQGSGMMLKVPTRSVLATGDVDLQQAPDLAVCVQKQKLETLLLNTPALCKRRSQYCCVACV